jgi:raffinose/stachyose/melibiose transport system substrate-binding protein
MKKQIVVVLTLLLYLLASVAWAGGSRADTAAQAEGPVTVNMWVLAGTTSDWWHSIKEQYESEHPDVLLNLDVQQFSNLYETTYPALASKAEDVDLIWSIGGARTDLFGTEGLLVDLAPYYEEHGWYDKVYPAVQNYKTPGAGMYFFNTDWIVSPVYYYNVDLFAEVGVQPPETLEDILVLGEKFKAAGYIPWALGAKSPSRLNKIIHNLLARFLTPDEMNELLFWERDPNKSVASAQIFRHPGVRQAYEAMAAMIRADMFPRGSLSMDEGAARLLFTNGEAAIYNTGSWGVGLIGGEAPDLNFSHFVLPERNGNTAMLAGFANGLIVPAWIEDRELEAVIDIMDSLTTREYAMLSFNSSLLSSCLCVTPADIAQVADPQLASIVEAVQANGSVDLFDPWASPDRNRDYNTMNSALIAGQMTVDEVLEFFYDSAIAVLE